MSIAFTPDFLERYQVLEPLGEGGMGTVYRGIQRSLDRPVAIKFLSRQLLDEEYLTRFRGEAKLAAQIFHSNLVAVIETGTMADLPYIVFELVPGMSLRAYLARAGGALPASEALELVRQAADGLACAHKAGIVHRDIKPENLLITPDGAVKVADFGVAKAQAAPGQKTRSGVIMGTPAYLSPEQAQERPVTPAADVWALGVVLHELLAGALPFARNTTLELLTAIVAEPPGALPPHVPAPVAELLARMLEKAPEARFASMSDLSREIARVAASLGEVPAAQAAAVSGAVRNSSGSTAGLRTAVVDRGTREAEVGALTRPVAAPSRPRPWRWVAAGAVLLALLAGAKRARLRRSAPPPQAPSASGASSSPTPSRAGEGPAEPLPAASPRPARHPILDLMAQARQDPEDRSAWSLVVDRIRDAKISELRAFACLPMARRGPRGPLCDIWTELARRDPVRAVSWMAPFLERAPRREDRRHTTSQDIPYLAARACEVLFYLLVAPARERSLSLADACIAACGTSGLADLVAAMKAVSAGSFATARAKLADFAKTPAAAQVSAESVAVLDAVALAGSLPAGWKATREPEARRALDDLVRYVTLWTGSDLRPFARELARAYHAALGGPPIPALAGPPDRVEGRLGALLAIARKHVSAHDPNAQLAGGDLY